MDVTNIPVEPVDVEKVAEENPQSRFRILDTAIKHPGTCVMCLSPGGDGRQFVDFNRTDTWYGVVYVCTFCLAEAARLLNFAPKSTYELALTNQQAEISNLDDMVVEARTDLDAYRRLLRNCNCSSSDSGSAESNSVSVDVESDGEGSDGTSNSDESGSVEGVDDVPGTSGAESTDAKPKRSRRSVSSAE